MEFANIRNSNCDLLSSNSLGSNLTCIFTSLSFLKGFPMEQLTVLELYKLQITESLLLLAI